MSNFHLTDPLRLGNHIQCVPIIHGRSIFAQEVRRLFLEDRYQCIAVELPHSLSSPVIEAVEYLPFITAVVYQELAGNHCYVPVEPGEAIMEAIRLGVQERLPIEFIDLEAQIPQTASPLLPDEYAISQIGLRRFYAGVLPYLFPALAGSTQEWREKWMAQQLRELDKRFSKVLFICGMAHLEGIRKHFYHPSRPIRPADQVNFDPKIYSVHPDGIFLLTGEIPYLTYLYEKSRQSLDLQEFDKRDGIKELLLEARNEYLKDFPEEAQQFSPATFQILLKYLRNLCLLQKRLTPSMYDLVVAAQGVGGGGLGAQTIEIAKFYPFIDPLTPYPTLKMGLNKALFEEKGEKKISNRLPSPPVELKHIRLERRPQPEKQEKWKKLWGTGGYSECSWPPEDVQIERFTAHVRKKAIGVLGEDKARIEKFSSSIKDGIDVKETLRQWHTGDIFVKEVPSVQGEVGAVVFIFDSQYEKYPWQNTWLAEHEEESTLAFYATDYYEDIIGPGIARAYYGGALFIYPPIVIPDIWENPLFSASQEKAETLVQAGVFYSQSKYVAYVAANKPSLRMRQFAKKYQKHLIYLPITHFSATTVRKLRKFHVLQGDKIRSYAQKYIR